jgi:pimeloyl-ACP methyl ester carboxylesterase
VRVLSCRKAALPRVFSSFKKSLCIPALLTLSLSFSAWSSPSSPEWPTPDTWDLNPANQTSLNLEPVRQDARSRDGLRLALKHFPRPGAQPLLLLHGLAQNDRGWDPAVRRYSFARYLHAQGFDVWAGNLRGSGTPGFRSEMPEGPHHWTIDDYAINDIPGLIDAVTQATGQKPFVIGHSLAAWAMDGYLAGLTYDKEGRAVPSMHRSLAQQDGIRGLVTIAGVYNLRWERPLLDAASNPIRSAVDFYHSNYELEMIARFKPIYRIVPNLARLPLGWIGDALSLPLDRIPFVGDRLSRLYRGVQSDIIGTPVLSMFYYAPGSDREMVRQHALDGLEDLGPRVLEQLGNAINDERTSSHYHLKRPRHAYDYSAVRERAEVPTLMIAGGRDRLASAYQVYEDGYLKTRAADKRFIHVEKFGHLDIVTGTHAPSAVMEPVVQWLRARY